MHRGRLEPGEPDNRLLDFLKWLTLSNGEHTERWTFSHTAGGVINWYSLSGRQGKPSPSDAFVRMDTRHPYLKQIQLHATVHGLASRVDFQPHLAPLDTGSHTQWTTFTFVCNSPARGKVHKVGGLHTVSFSCGSLNVERLRIVPAWIHSPQSYIYLWSV